MGRSGEPAHNAVKTGIQPTGTFGNSPSVNDTARGDLAAPGIYDPTDDAIAEVAGAIRRTPKGTSRMIALLTLAATLAAQAVPRLDDYFTGYQCFLGSSCWAYAKITDCIACCNANCNYGGLHEGCVDACLGLSSGEALTKVQTAATSIQNHTYAPSDLPSLVRVVEAGMRHSNPRIALAATAIAGETPFVRIQ